MIKRRLLFEMTRQFYEDCKYIAENNSTQPLDEDGCATFNAILQEAQTEFPEYELLLKFREMPPRSVKFKDAMLVAGQLHRIVANLTELSGRGTGAEAPKAAPRPAAPPQAASRPSGTGASTAPAAPAPQRSLPSNDNWPQPASTSGSPSPPEGAPAPRPAAGGGGPGAPIPGRAPGGERVYPEPPRDSFGFSGKSDYLDSFKERE